jgi:Tfp pilus assembly protein PilZ
MAHHGANGAMAAPHGPNFIYLGHAAMEEKMTSARLADRIDCQMEVDVLKTGMEMPNRIQGHNLSQSGMFLAAADYFRVGDRLSLRFNTNAEEEVYIRSAEVVWIRSETEVRLEDEPSGVGVRFLTLESSGRSRIASYMKRSADFMPVAEEAPLPLPLSGQDNSSSSLTPKSSARQWAEYGSSAAQPVAERKEKKFSEWSFSLQPDSGLHPAAEGEVDMGAPNSLVESALTTFDVESIFDVAPQESGESKAPDPVEYHLTSADSTPDALTQQNQMQQGEEPEMGFATHANLEALDHSHESHSLGLDAPIGNAVNEADGLEEDKLELEFDDDAPGCGPTADMGVDTQAIADDFHSMPFDNADCSARIEAEKDALFEKLDAAFAKPDTSIAEIETCSPGNRESGANSLRYFPALFAILALAVVGYASASFLTLDENTGALTWLPFENSPAQNEVQKTASVRANSVSMENPHRAFSEPEAGKANQQKKVSQTGKQTSPVKPLFPRAQHVEPHSDKTRLGESGQPQNQNQAAKNSAKAAGATLSGLVIEQGRITLPLKNGKVVKRFSLTSPTRVVIDLVNAQFPGHQEQKIEKNGIAKLRIGKPDADHVRVVVELNRKGDAKNISTLKRTGTLAIAWK